VLITRRSQVRDLHGPYLFFAHSVLFFGFLRSHFSNAIFSLLIFLAATHAGRAKKIWVPVAGGASSAAGRLAGRGCRPRWGGLGARALGSRLGQVCSLLSVLGPRRTTSWTQHAVRVRAISVSRSCLHFSNPRQNRASKVANLSCRPRLEYPCAAIELRQR
jgi:hypothetical protein